MSEACAFVSRVEPESGHGASLSLASAGQTSAAIELERFARFRKLENLLDLVRSRQDTFLSRENRLECSRSLRS